MEPKKQSKIAYKEDQDALEVLSRSEKTRLLKHFTDQYANASQLTGQAASDELIELESLDSAKNISSKRKKEHITTNSMPVFSLLGKLANETEIVNSNPLGVRDYIQERLLNIPTELSEKEELDMLTGNYWFSSALPLQRSQVKTKWATSPEYSWTAGAKLRNGANEKLDLSQTLLELVEGSIML
jgi:hypothetical protein